MIRAALLTRLNAPLEVEEVRPCNLGYGQVLVRMLCSGICGAQLQEISGEKAGGPLPHPLGHEGCGIVEDTGPGVRRVDHGDKVVLHWRPGLGIESDFPRYRGPGGGVITGGRVTTFGEMVVASENRVTRVPHDTPDDFCAMLGCGLSTALGTIESEARLQFGQTILVVGCGGLGINLILAARLAQASRITALDLREDKRPTAMDMGAHAYIATDFEHWKEQLRQAGPFDAIVNTAAAPASIEDTLPFLAPSGCYVLVGQPPPGAGVTIADARHLFEGDGKRILATQGGGFNPTRDIPRYVAMHAAGLLPIAGLVTHRVRLEQINEGVELVRMGQAGRVLIEMGD